MEKAEEYDNGCIVSEPQAVILKDKISEMTLEEMDKAVENLKVGDVSPSIDLSDF